MINSEPETESILNIEKIRNDFPLLQTKVYGKPLIYLDNAATTQKPLPVLEALNDYYTRYNSNVHRGVHFLVAGYRSLRSGKEKDSRIPQCPP